MKIAILTNEYPPHVYGGAGVHVEYLSRALAELDDGANQVEVLCFGEQKIDSPALSVHGIEASLQMPVRDHHHLKFYDALFKNFYMAEALQNADLVHCHTWYTHFAGCLLKQMLDVPLVLTTHSLEPQRPWKEEQLGAAYRASSWIEKTAYQNADGVIAVSRSMQSDVEKLYGAAPRCVRVIHNGIDLNEYKPAPDPALLKHYGIDPYQPIVLFVGRITRQKGITHFLNAIPYISPKIQAVLCAGMPDTAELGREITEKVELTRARTSHQIIWIPQFLPKQQVISLYTHASVFVCPSIYEPFGIINLEAMACGATVVASATGGITEVVNDGETGLLVPFEPSSDADFEPRYPDQFARDLATAIDSLLSQPARLKAMGISGRHRVEQHFSWESIARRTLQFYRELTGMRHETAIFS